jgi:hypothetical protein
MTDYHTDHLPPPTSNDLIPFRQWEDAVGDLQWLFNRAWNGHGAVVPGPFVHITSRRMRVEIARAQRREEVLREVLFREFGQKHGEAH